MTKKLSTGAPMELDLDSFLQLHSTSDDDDEHLNAIPHRTVDEILDDSDSSSSSSSSSSNSFNTKQKSRNRKLSNSSVSRRNSSSGATDETRCIDEDYPVSSTSEVNSVTRVSAVDAPKKDAEILNSVRLDERFRDLKVNLIGRRKSSSFSGSFGRDRPLPALFGGVKPNPKPGAALAAAAAASRAIPRSHAAAIKERRTSSSGTLQKDLDSSALAAVPSAVVDDSEITLDGSGVFKAASNVESGVNQLDGKLGKGDEKIEVFTAPLDEFVNREGSKERKVLGGEEVLNMSHYDNGQEISGERGKPFEVDDAVVLNSEIQSKDSSSSECIERNASINSPETVNKSNVDANFTALDPTGALGVHNHFSDGSENGYKLNEDSTLPGSAPSFHSAYEENKKVVGDSMSLGLEAQDLETGRKFDVSDGEVSLSVDDSGSKSEINEVVLDGELSYLDGKRGNEKFGEKLQSSMNPLELAEELEKKLASSGLHWEEGAAAQPMRLEGIRRGPPAVGYLQIDPNNAITRTLSSHTFKQDHGSAQVLAVHANFIAVGMSKGLVLVAPSRYSAHNVDHMDAKMLWLASQGDKSHSPVTSMCFNQQGDLLLAGYGDGHLIIWDLQKVAIAKVISGEHMSPVVHTLFLGQDLQVTRQFKAVTGDCKGLVLLHSISVVPLLNRFTVKTQCLLDGQRTGIVLSASSLLIDDFGSALMPAPGNATASPGGIGSMMGGVVGGVLFSEGPSLVEEGVVIFVTHQNALVVRLSPAIEFYAQLPRPEGVREGSMPYTAWKCVMRLRDSSTENIPSEMSEKASLLAIAWDRKIQVAKLVKSELKVYREWSLDSAAVGVAWLDDQMLVVPTVRGQLCLFSKEGDEIHRTSFTLDGFGVDDLIAYHTHFTNKFGNPEKAYHNCVSVRGATIYMLGPMHLVVSRLLPWKERIQVLRTAGDWMGALDMAMKLYDGNAHGVIDLPRTLDAIQQVIMPYLVDLILSYVDEVFSYLSVAFFNQTGRGAQVLEQQSELSTVQSEIEDQFARVGGVAVEFCVHIKRIDILFDDIFSKFVAVQQGGTFLELLEPYILKDMLGCLPPEIMQALVEHYSKRGWLQRVEQCVLHMDISSLDFNQVVRLCREHGLYGALIYLFNRGLDDFRTPLEELLLLLCDSKRENATNIGYRMLVYLKYCFSGLAFPPGHGALPLSRLPSLRKELVQFLLEHSDAINAKMAASLKASIASCPNLYHLLQLDTEATLEVLRYAFLGEEICKSDHVVANENMEDNKESTDNRENQDMMVQNTIDALISILDSDISEEDGFSGIDDAKSLWPSKKDIGHLLEFIAHFVACKQATVSKTILNHTFKFLTSENNLSVSSQKIGNSKRREKQMLDLLKAVPDTDWDSSYVLHLCERAKFYQVCGYIHTTRSHYVAALESYMRDLDEPINAFSFIHDKLLHLRDAESVNFHSAVIDRISELVDLSREGAFLLVIDHFHKESDLILSQLQSHPKSLFLFLKTTIEVHLSGKLDFSSLEKGNVGDLRNRSKLKDQPDELKAYMERIDNFPKLIYENPVLVNDEMVELYLELLCQYEQDSVLKFLETFENYRLEHCLHLCQEYGVIDAAAFLLERAGDVGASLSLTLSCLSGKLSLLDCAVENVASEQSFHSLTDREQVNNTLKIPEVNAVHDILHACIGLCQRNTRRLDPEESEFLWFQLLDSFCDPLRDSCDVKMDTSLKGQDNRMHVATFGTRDERVSASNWKIPKSHKGASLLCKVFSQFIRDIVEGMIGYVHLPTVMAKLLSDNGDQEFGDFKLAILDMLGTYGFERRILDTAKSLIEDDTFYTMSLLKKGASHGYAPRKPVCNICSGILTKAHSGIRLFNCGHATHLQCEFPDSEGSKSESSGCPVCMPKKKTRRSKNKSVLEVNGLVKNSVTRSQQIQGNSIIQHLHESDLADKAYGLQQISRYEILSNLQKSKKSFQIENMPQLRLAPPAVYHEKVKKRTDFTSGESSSTVKSEKPRKSRQLQELKMKGSVLWSPLKSSIFGNEKARSR